MTHSVPTRLILTMVLFHPCSLLLRLPVNQAVHSVVFPPRSCTAQILPHLPTHRPAPAWHHPWLHRVKPRLRIVPSPHRRQRPLLLRLPPHLHQPPLTAPAPPSLVPPLPFSFPSPSAARSQIATSRTSRQMASSTT